MARGRGRGERCVKCGQDSERGTELVAAGLRVFVCDQCASLLLDAATVFGGFQKLIKRLTR